MPLHHICGPVHYIPGVTNVGVIVAKEGRAILIDSGVGDRSGRTILRALEEARLRPVAIFNTHTHGDHTGGNAHIVEKAGARVYAPRLDSVVLEQPAWGTVCLFMGSEPLPQLEVARYAPRACHVDVLVEEGTYEEAGVAVQAVPLHGHTGSHTGYLVEGVLFTGDALAGRREMEAARVSYLYSVTCQLASLEYLRTLHCQRYVPAHDEPRDDIAELITLNVERMQEVLDVLLTEMAAGPQQATDLLAALCRHHGLEPRHLRDYLLLHATLHSYLGHLHRAGLARFELSDHKLWWGAA